MKLDGKMNWSMHKVLRKLAKKHGLKKIGRDKACMYVEDQALVLQTNLVTTEKRYPTDTIGYKLNSIYNWVALQRIGPRPFLVSAIGTHRLRCYGIQRVALIECC